MTDNTELKRLAEAANAVTGDVSVDIAISSERGPNQSEIDAVTAFVGAATPAAVLALIAENESVHKHWQNESNNVQVLVAEFARLKAENEIFEEGMRSIACSLSAGGYNAETLTATQLVEKVQWGVDHFADTSGRMVDQLRAEVAGLKTGYEAYERVNAELKAEVEALREEVALDDKIIADRDRLLNMFDCPAHGQCIPYAMEQIEALRKDADRYQWLKVDDVDRDDLYTSTSGVDMDSAIDAALGQGEQS